VDNTRFSSCICTGEQDLPLHAADMEDLVHTPDFRGTLTKQGKTD
jgi:hypothetical protein